MAFLYAVGFFVLAFQIDYVLMCSPYLCVHTNVVNIEMIFMKLVVL